MKRAKKECNTNTNNKMTNLPCALRAKGQPTQINMRRFCWLRILATCTSIWIFDVCDAGRSTKVLNHRAIRGKALER